MQTLWEADLWNPTFFHSIWLGLFTMVSNETSFQSCCKMWICRLGFICDWCMLMCHHILLFGNSWTTDRTRWTNIFACSFLWFESLRFLSLWTSQVYCLCYRIQWCLGLATMKSEWIWDHSYNIQKFTVCQAQCHSSDVQHSWLQLSEDTSRTLFNLHDAISQKPCFRWPMFINHFLIVF